MSFTSTLIYFAFLASSVSAHMSIYHPAMWGMNTQYPPSSPIGPDWHFDDWWFRGAATRNSPPDDGLFVELPAGGSVMLEIACHIAWTTYGWSTTNNVACPNNNGAYHSGDPNGPIDHNLLAGCALAIADVENLEDVTIDNLAVFSVQQECVWKRDTTFQVPAKMPACSGENCICAWLWEPQNGTGNYYQTPFRCKVTGSAADATPISTPLKDPVYCPNSQADCTKGAKRPIYFYNYDYWNVNWVSNYARPGYHSSWSWTDGAQNDIFMTAAQAANYTKPVPISAAQAAANHTTYVYPLNTDLAMNATATASSFADGQPPSAAIDGVISGYMDYAQGIESAEWSSDGEQAGAWLKLTWANPVTINLVVLYDRPNFEDWCWAGKLQFDDGSVVIHGTLDNSGGATPVTLDARTTKSLTWTCTQVSVYTSNIGLAEIEVYGPTSPAYNATTNSTTTSNSSVATNSSSVASTALPSSTGNATVSSVGATLPQATSNATSSSAPSTPLNTTLSSVPTSTAVASSSIVASAPSTSATSSVLSASSAAVVSTQAPVTSSVVASDASSSGLVSTSATALNTTSSTLPAVTSAVSQSSTSSLTTVAPSSSASVKTTTTKTTKTTTTKTTTTKTTTTTTTTTTTKASSTSKTSSAKSSSSPSPSSSTTSAKVTSSSSAIVTTSSSSAAQPSGKAFNTGASPLVPLAAQVSSFVSSTASPLPTVPVPGNSSLCFLPTPTTVPTTSTVCAGRVCTSVPTSSVLSVTLCANATSTLLSASTGVKSTPITSSSVPSPSAKVHARDFSARR